MTLLVAQIHAALLQTDLCGVLTPSREVAAWILSAATTIV